MEGFGAMYFLLSNFCEMVTPKINKSPSVNCTNCFFNFKKCKKNRHLLRKKIHMSPYLDNEFLEVAIIRQNYTYF
jgi:hypothetical protein